MLCSSSTRNGSVCSGDTVFVHDYGAHRALHSFPTRRSSDLGHASPPAASSMTQRRRGTTRMGRLVFACCPPDRKSTRLNSSHSQISYAVFCLKKKNSPVPPSAGHSDPAASYSAQNGL